MESKILQALEFQINPITWNVWMNLYMAEWDAFADANVENFPFLDPEKHPEGVPKFKTENLPDFKRFRQSMQVCDVALLDIKSQSFNRRKLTAAVLYF